jgi:hypothetical protein
MHARSLPTPIVAPLLLCTLFSLPSSAQVVLHERVVIDPGRAAAGQEPGGLLEGFLSPCNPPHDDLGPPVITRRSVFPGESLSLAALTCPTCPPHHMSGELTQGAGYVRLELNRPPGLGGEINGTSFHFREAWGYDVLAVFDQAIPGDSALVTFTMTYVDFPPPNIEYIEVYFVPRQFRIVTRLEPGMIEQGGSSALSAWVLDQCGGGYPSAVTYTASILSGGERGVLQNPVTLEKGQQLSDLSPPSGYTPTVVFLAEGLDADTTTDVRIRIAASSPGVEPVLLVLPVKPGPTCPVVSLDPADIATGDSCRITIMQKTYGGMIKPYPPGQLFSIMLYPGESGTLYSPSRADTSDYFDAVPQDGLLWLTAGEVAEESVSVYMWVNEVVAPSGESRQTLRGKQANKSSAGGLILGPEEETCNAAFASLKKKPFEIMLGETKYYQAKNDPRDTTKLMIQELQTPILDGGIPEDVWGTCPIPRSTGATVVVYWDKVYPLFISDSSEPQMDPLPLGLLRLVGRYIGQSGAQPARVKATHFGRTGEREIRVVMPALLGETNNRISGPSFQDGVSQFWSLDSMIIAEAGKEGIQPQVLKAIIRKESNFFPTYRYEPFDDLSKIQKPASDFDSLHRYWIHNAIQLGQPGIATHENLRDGNGSLIQYPGFQNLWSYYSSNSRLYGRRIYSSLQQKWNQLYQKARDSLWRLVKSDQRAADSASILAESSYVRWLKFEFGDSGMVKMVAQTRIAASYGLMQLTYYNGTRRLHGHLGYAYPNNDPGYPPELLNVPPVGLKYGLLHFKRKVQDVLGNIPFDDDSWNTGLEVVYWRALKRYNGSRRYPYPVLQFTKQYLPLRQSPSVRTQ